MPAKLKKQLGLVDVFCISSGAMISSGLFILPALAYAKTGSVVVVAYLLAGLLMLPTVLSKAELTTAMPKTGGIFFFTDRSMGPVVGTIGGFGAWLSLAFKSAFALLGMGLFLYLFDFGLSDLQVKLAAVGFCLVFMTLNILGVKLASKVQVFLVFALISLLVLYTIVGLFHLDFGNYTPLMHDDVTLSAIPATAGLVFISYAGTTKTAAVAGEVKNPGRNLPMGMLLSWGICTVLYICVIMVTIGVLDKSTFMSTDTPISLGGYAMFGIGGLVLMSIAGMLAFITTANGGIMAASRDPMAMGSDGLLPKFFTKTSPKFGTPWVSIVITTGIMICVILFLDLETFVKTASTLKLMLFILANLAVIFMREANMPHYRPKYKAPLYPYIQIIAVVAYTFLIFQMGWIPLAIVGVFLVLSLLWYFIYTRGKVKRQYALSSIVARLNGTKPTNLLDGELRGILAERDNVTAKRFKRKLKKAAVLDLPFFMAPGKFSEHVSKKLAKRFGLTEGDLFKSLTKREKDSSILLGKNMAIISFHIKGRNRFEMAIVRTKKGARFSEGSPPTHAAIIVVSSPDEKSFYYNSLMWLVQASESLDFEKQWMNAKGEKELKRMVVKACEQCVMKEK